MIDIATHVRIFEASPTDDFVQKRQSAITALSRQFQERKTFSDILELADGLAAALAHKGRPPDWLSVQVATALKDVSTSFVMEGHELEARVCALLAAATYLASAVPGDALTSRSDVLALGLWSALSFQKSLAHVKLEKLRADLVGLARELATNAAERSRTRAHVPDATFTLVEAEGLAGLDRKLKAGPLKTLEALKLNAELDREEIDVLWWVLGDWSAIYGGKFSSMDEHLSPLVASFEIAQLLKRVPGEAHKNLILRLVQGGGDENLATLIAKLSNKHAALAAQIRTNSLVSSCPHVFPLLNALIDPAFKIDGSKEIRSPTDWACRALLEFGLLRSINLPI
jgi:hypothetical protein